VFGTHRLKELSLSITSAMPRGRNWDCPRLSFPVQYVAGDGSSIAVIPVHHHWTTLTRVEAPNRCEVCRDFPDLVGEGKQWHDRIKGCAERKLLGGIQSGSKYDPNYS
jgi:hypothetical protein